MDTWRGIGVRTSHGGVVGTPMRCTKMDQNWPKLIQMVTTARTSKSALNSFSVTSGSISGLNNHLKGDRSQKRPWRGGGVTHDKNRPKQTIMNQNGHHSMAEQKFRICPRFQIRSISGLNVHLKGERSQNLQNFLYLTPQPLQMSINRYKSSVPWDL